MRPDLEPAWMSPRAYIASAGYGLALALLIWMVAVAVTGCATLAPETRVETRTVTTEVKVPVPIACVSPADVPLMPRATPIDIEHATTDQKAAATAADAEAFERYAKAMAALIEQCKTGGRK